jgi:hypothetical protein
MSASSGENRDELFEGSYARDQRDEVGLFAR